MCSPWNWLLFSTNCLKNDDLENGQPRGTSPSTYGMTNGLNILLPPFYNTDPIACITFVSTLSLTTNKTRITAIVLRLLTGNQLYFAFYPYLVPYLHTNTLLHDVCSLIFCYLILNASMSLMKTTVC